jgi:outer membrane protein TolC
MTIARSTARTGRSWAATLAALLALSLATPVPAQDDAPARGVVDVDEAVRRALERNHDLLSARENIEAAEGRKKQALQRYMPSLGAGVNYRRNFDNRFTQSGVTFLVNPDNYSTNYTFSQNLIDWGAYKSIQAAGRSLNGNRYDYEQARADLVLATKQQYYALVRAQLLSDVADSALVVSQQELRRVQSLFELGMVARGDVLKAQVRLSQSQLDVISNRNVVVLERARLARLMGQEPSDDLSAARDVAATPAIVDSAAVFDEAMRNRSDLRAAEAFLAAADANVGAAKAGYLPTLRGSLNYSSSDTAFALSGDRTRTGSLSLDFPLFSALWGTRGDIQASKASRNQARYALDRTRLDVAVEVREAISNARQANEGLLVAQDQVTSAEEDLKLSQEKYNVGSGTILELIDAQVALQRARSNYVQALTQVRSSEASLERVRGRTY